jgi:hypothetical protein
MNGIVLVGYLYGQCAAKLQWLDFAQSSNKALDLKCGVLIISFYEIIQYTMSFQQSIYASYSLSDFIVNLHFFLIDFNYLC